MRIKKLANAFKSHLFFISLQQNYIYNKVEPKKIKNIAFDLGGVVLALSLEGGIKGFERIGLKDARQRLDAFVQ